MATSTSHDISLQQRRTVGSGDCRIRFNANASSASLSVTPVDANKIPAIIKDLPDMPRADGEQTRFCTISQESSTSTPIFTSDNDCADFSSAGITGSLYTNIGFKEGFFKAGAAVRCVSTAYHSAGFTGSASIESATDIPLLGSSTFNILVRNSGDQNVTRPWEIFCSGPRP